MFVNIYSHLEDGNLRVRFHSRHTAGVYLLLHGEVKGSCPSHDLHCAVEGMRYIWDGVECVECEDAVQRKEKDIDSYRTVWLLEASVAWWFEPFVCLESEWTGKRRPLLSPNTMEDECRQEQRDVKSIGVDLPFKLISFNLYLTR